jgi:cobalt/nickel transport system ATP-binding protein
MSAVLSCGDVTVRYRNAAADALRGLSLRVGPGERVALLGLNGSGKTTLFSAVAGLVPFTGVVEVCGLPVTRANLRAVRDRLGYLFGVPDDQLLFPRVLDDVAFTLRRRGLDEKAALSAAQAMLDKLGAGAAADAAPHQLSQGQRQRVALAGVLAAEPPLLLLDEPTASLDPAGKAELARLLDGLPCAILLATHDTAFARRAARRFIVLKAGEVAEDTADPSCPARFADAWAL